MEPSPKTFSLLEEFKKFAFKGNVIDLAIGVIIGAAFGAIIKSLVEDLVMPVISSILPGGGYTEWKAVINGAEVPYGKFLGAVVTFLVTALALFIFIVKFLGWLMRARKPEIAPLPPPLTKDQELLSEIRDLLKQR
jgi:large conductance mechanosensitive channel